MSRIPEPPDSSSTRGAPTRRPFTGRTVLWIFVGFFVIVFAANVALVRLAVDSHSGTVEEAAYDKGLDYNARLAAAEAEQALGWSVSLSAERSPDGAGAVVLNVTGDDGAPVVGLQVSGRLVRAVESAHDLSLDFTETGGGRYRAQAAIPFPGQWDARILLVRGDDRFRLTERIVF